MAEEIPDTKRAHWDMSEYPKDSKIVQSVDH
jgi:hypothetical protein